MRSLTLSTNHPAGFKHLLMALDDKFLGQPALARGEWQSQSQVPAHMATRDLNHVLLELPIPDTMTAAQTMVEPNLPWAEDHFQERVGRKPLNPPPSSEWWPFATKKHEGHVDADKKFSHTYPERFWPVWPPEPEGERTVKVVRARRGVRYNYGDLDDLVAIMARNSWTRQAYLPVWFPEDLAASSAGQRVPCTIGYHFLRTQHGVDCTYHIRSCDYVRHFQDDVYMAMRLTQWVVGEVQRGLGGGGSREQLVPGKLFMHISNFHTFLGDDDLLESRLEHYSGSIQEVGGDE